MKPLKSAYWVSTGLMAAFMLMASVPDVLQVPEARAIFRHLGYPEYLLPFLGTAKILGVVAVLVPGLQRLREWAYAGLLFDVTGALYSQVVTGDPPSALAFPVVGLFLVSASYLAYRTRSVPRTPGVSARRQPAGHSLPTAAGAARRTTPELTRVDDVRSA